MLIESNIRNVGTAVKCRELSAAIMDMVSEELGDDYSDERSTYRLGDLIMLFPLEHLPDILANCEWSISVDSATNEPLALFPDIDASTASDLRQYLCIVAKSPVVFYHCSTHKVYVAYMHHDWTIGAWFSLAAHDFIHSDTEN